MYGDHDSFEISFVGERLADGTILAEGERVGQSEEQFITKTQFPEVVQRSEPN